MAQPSPQPLQLTCPSLSLKRQSVTRQPTSTRPSFLSTRLSLTLSFTVFIYSLFIPVSCYRIALPDTITAGVPVIATWFLEPNDPQTFGIVENNLMIDAFQSVIPIIASASFGTIELTLSSPGQFVLPAATETALADDDQRLHIFGAGQQIAVLAGTNQPSVITPPPSTPETPVTTATPPPPPPPPPSTPSPLPPPPSDSPDSPTLTSAPVPTEVSDPQAGSITAQGNTDSETTSKVINTMIVVNQTGGDGTETNDITQTESQSPQTSLGAASVSDSESVVDASSNGIAGPSASPTSTQSSTSIADPNHTSLGPGGSSPNPSDPHGPGPETQSPHHNSNNKDWRKRLAIILGVISAVFISGALFWYFFITKQRYANNRRIELFRERLRGLGMTWISSSSRDSGSTYRTSSVWGPTHEDTGHHDGSETATIRRVLSNRSLGFGSFASHGMRERDLEENDLITFQHPEAQSTHGIERANGDEAWGKSRSPGASLNISRLSPPDSVYSGFTSGHYASSSLREMV